MSVKKMDKSVSLGKIITISVVILILLFICTRIRIITVPNGKVILFNNPFKTGSGSVGADLLEDFVENGKSSDNVKDIIYIGSNMDGAYYECQYVETDGTVTIYYGLDDNDLNSDKRAEVLWK